MTCQDAKLASVGNYLQLLCWLSATVMTSLNAGIASVGYLQLCWLSAGWWRTNMCFIQSAAMGVISQLFYYYYWPLVSPYRSSGDDSSHITAPCSAAVGVHAIIALQSVLFLLLLLAIGVPLLIQRQWLLPHYCSLLCSDGSYQPSLHYSWRYLSLLYCYSCHMRGIHNVCYHDKYIILLLVALCATSLHQTSAIRSSSTYAG